MLLDTIEMDQNEARQAFLDYRHAVRERHDAEDEAIMRGYRELSRGRRLIRLSDTIRKGGLDDQGRPHLAVAQADHIHCVLTTSQWRDDAQVTFADEYAPAPRRQRGVFRFRGLFERDDLSVTKWDTRWRAVVPNVPPALRPRHHLRNYAVLFEAEWHRDPVPPKDPALLKRLGGDLYAVLAMWDLTEIERAVLFGTRASA